MPAPAAPKHRAIYDRLRADILDGTHPPGARLPSQQELAASFDVTLMTLRQAVAALEADGLVRAERGRGTFVADRPVDVALGNLSSFADQLALDGVSLVTEVLGDDDVADPPDEVRRALGVEGTARWIERRRSVDGVPVAVQTSWMAADLGVGRPLEGSLYAAIEAVTGRIVSEAREHVTAVVLRTREARVLEAKEGEAAIRSVRTSLDQFGRPFLHDEALLVGARCTIAAHRTSNRLDLRYLAR